MIGAYSVIGDNFRDRADGRGGRPDPFGKFENGSRTVAAQTFIARRLAGRISTRFEWSSMPVFCDRRPLGGLAEHEKTPSGEAVAEAYSCCWMFEMG